MLLVELNAIVNNNLLCETEQYQHQKAVQNSPNGPHSVIPSVRTIYSRRQIEAKKENNIGITITNIPAPVASDSISPNSQIPAVTQTTVLKLTYPTFCDTKIRKYSIVNTNCSAYLVVMW